MPRRPTPNPDDETPEWKAETRRIHNDLAEAVRNAYTAHGYTQEQFAAVAEIPYRTMQRLDAGRGWHIGYLVRAARGLGIDPAVILREAGVSDVATDTLSSAALDPTLSPVARAAVAAVVQAFRNEQPSSQEERHLRELGFEFDRPRNQ